MSLTHVTRKQSSYIRQTDLNLPNHAIRRAS